MYYHYHLTPIGQILIAGDEQHIHLLSFPEGDRVKQPQPDWQQNSEPFHPAIKQLDQYFCGQLTQFELPLKPQGTAFQQDVWNALLSIPYGQTINYGELAKRINRPQASRAVGAANGANPIPIIIPCHRVIGANGKLTGFGGGLPTKQWLLQHEGAWLESQHKSQQTQIQF